MQSSKNLLCLFVKAPFLGKVKTRLQPHVNTEDSMALYMAMVQDLIEKLKTSPKLDLIVWYWPLDGEKSLQAMVGDRIDLQPQQGSDLGNRMHYAFMWAKEKEYEKTIIVGSDIPELKLDAVQEAFHLLDGSDAVIGPSPDGGYYLIGLKEPRPSLFQNMIWSTPSVLEITIQKFQTARVKYKLLQSLEDIDTYGDIVQLYQRWQNLMEAGETVDAPRTFRMFEKIIQQEGRHG